MKGRQGQAVPPLPNSPESTRRRIWVATVVLSVIACVAVGLAPVLSVMVVVALALVVATALSPDFALTSIVVSALVMLGLESALGLPSAATVLTKVLIGVFALSTLFNLRNVRARAHLMALGAWLIVLAVSAVFGMSARLLALQAFWTYACGPIVALAILYSNLSLRSLRRVSIAVVVIGVAELPIVLFQNAFVATHVDQIGGTFGTVGGTSIVAIVAAFAWCAAISLLRDRSRVWLIPVAGIIATILLVAEAKAGFFFCAIGTVAVGISRGIQEKRFASLSIQYVALASAAVASLYAGYLYAGNVLKGGARAATIALQDVGSEKAIVDYLFSYGPLGQAGRLEGTRLAFTQGRPKLVDLLLGRGPGLLSYSALLGGSSSFAVATGLTFDWSTSLTRSILETGLLGTVLYVGVVASAVWTVASAWRAEASARGISVVSACVGLTTVYLLGGAYAMPWHTDAVAVLFWCLLGLAAKWGLLRCEGEGGPASPSLSEAGESNG